jgi:hypothetical protein
MGRLKYGKYTDKGGKKLFSKVLATLDFNMGCDDINQWMQMVFAYGLDANQVVSVWGHTDNIGSDAINNLPPATRTTTVRDYLVVCGVITARLT